MDARFITFEGIEGSGKSTVAKEVHDRLLKAGIAVVMTREPGGTETSEDIRHILLDPKRSLIHAKTELLLYLASRAQLVEELVKPTLASGQTVLCDRFMDASAAYQGWARGLGEDTVEKLNDFAVGGLKPDVTFLLDLPVEKGFQRGPESREDAGERHKDRLEREERSFHERVREGYLRLAEREKERVVVIDAALPLEKVVVEILGELESRFGVKL